jgi:DNA-binding transcriptional regulator YhcF (GntR family)
VADINKEKLREEKLAEISDRLTKIIKTAKKFDIEKGEIFALVREIEEKRNESHR